MENVSHNTSYDSADNLSRDPNPIDTDDLEITNIDFSNRKWQESTFAAKYNNQRLNKPCCHEPQKTRAGQTGVFSTIFCGNIGFITKEQTIWEFFS